MKKISIVIPVYNVEKFVERCILSCEKQDIHQEEFELIVVNDGSNDSSLNIIKELVLSYANIKILDQDNQGLSMARNNGFKMASGQYVWFVDSDDWIEENCLGELYRILMRDNLDALSLSYCQDFGNRKILSCNKKCNDGLVFSGINMLLEGGWSHCVPFTIYRSDFLRVHQLCFYEGIYHEDTEFTPRAYFYLRKVSSYSRAVYHYFYNDSSITNKVNPKKSFDNIIVAESLYRFSRQITERKLRQVYNNIIAVVINNALFNSYAMTIEDTNLLNRKLKENRFVSHALWGSKSVKYKLEGVLFYLFPKHIIRIYKVIQKLNI